jgi:uncharacterized protein
MTRSPNRLQHETSPYLQQHAQNPVDWYPWGPEAIAAAKQEGKPIFLSIGYSACHWCHVMEHESFENEAIAAIMNKLFINIKVDREERPDLDSIYMSAVVALTGHGGWPMSVFLTPELKPFFGGTYWPPTAKYNRPGFQEILQGVHRAWNEQRADLENQANQLTQAVVDSLAPTLERSTLGQELLAAGLSALVRVFDRIHGGFGHAPKFPHPMDLRYALRAAVRFDTDEALEVVHVSLGKMARGGIYDHLGGGFARYSTDEKWLVPHFEKMLYDNALLVPVYTEAWQLTGREEYATIVRETLDYVLREMTQPGGGFYSTQDADSEGVEGKFFVWSREEVISLLGATEGEFFCSAYDVTAMGNWEHTNILNRIETPEQFAKRVKQPSDSCEARLAAGRKVLFEARAKRIAPGRDEKILTSWNGLMIGACALAGRVLGEERYLLAARDAAQFVLETMVAADGRLWHTYKDGRAHLNGYLDDYGCLIDGLAELYQATFEPKWLAAAINLADYVHWQFWDAAEQAYFFTSDDHERLIARAKDTQDNATPSGNSVMAWGLVKLARLTGRADFEDRARLLLDFVSGQLAQAPLSGGMALCALDMLLGPGPEVVWTFPAGRPSELPGWETLQRRFVPGLILSGWSASDKANCPEVLAELLKDKLHQPGLYVCQRGACAAPVLDAAGADAALTQLTSLPKPS